MGQPVVHFEIGSRNAETAKRFYGGLFGWDIQSHGPANMIATGSKVKNYPIRKLYCFGTPDDLTTTLKQMNAADDTK